MFMDYELNSISNQCYCEVVFWISHCELWHGSYDIDHMIYELYIVCDIDS